MSKKLNSITKEIKSTLSRIDKLTASSGKEIKAMKRELARQEGKPKTNDQRSTVKNPNNPQHEKDKTNTKKQVQETKKKK